MSINHQTWFFIFSLKYQALDDKYDLLKDKLLAEALMNQLGAKRWNEMSERERQERLMKLKLLERKLRREGEY